MNSLCGIVLLRNERKYIDEFLSQPLHAFTHIFFCDNESSDGTYEYLAEKFGIPKISTEEGSGLNPKYTAGKFTFIRKKYTNPTQSYNTILGMVNQPYNNIGFININSCFHEDFFDIALQKLNNNHSISCVFSDFYTNRSGFKERVFVNQIDCEKSLDDNIKNIIVKYEYIRNGVINGQYESAVKNIVMQVVSNSLAYHIPKPLFTEI
jgi:hypothetical protein